MELRPAAVEAGATDLLAAMMRVFRRRIAPRQRQREEKHHCAEPGGRQTGRQERQGHEPIKREPARDRKPQGQRRPDNYLSGIRAVIHGGMMLEWRARGDSNL